MTLKQALDAGLITSDDYASAKTAFLRAQQIRSGFESGLLSKADYDLAVADLVAYLKWMSEPNQADRIRLGVWVLLFLSIFTVIAWRLNAAFWKDVK